MSQPATDRNLLFGILALQMDFISRDALIDAMNAWLVQKHRPLGEILEERGALSPADRRLLEPLVGRHVEQHGDDPARSLASLSSVSWLRRGLGAIAGADAELAASVVRIGSDRDDGADPYAMVTTSVGDIYASGARFRILRPHASGGLGEVFVARDAELNREVALKQIKDSYADHPESRSRFLLEAEITGGLEHPGIVPVYGLGADGFGRPYYAMRFIKGDSLKDAIGRFHKDQAARGEAGGRVVELQKLLRRFLDVCNAVAYAHSRGVLHRDIKPGNIMVGQYGETLVVDWGLAKVVGTTEPSAEATLRPPSAAGSSETQPGSAIGTPAFMSPEQAEGRLDRLGPASDVYSLGATLYCLLTGRVPIEEREIAAALERVRKGEIAPPRQLKPDLPRALEAVCLKAMALRPEDRYPTPRALADDLERWLADEPVSAWREPLSVRTQRWTRRHRNLVTILVAGLAMGSIGLAYVAMVQSEARTKIEDAFSKQMRAGSIAEGRLNLALDAVRAYHNEVSDDILLKRAEFGDLRKKLLQWPLTFYQKVGELAGPENQDPKNLATIADLLARLGLLTRDVGTKEKAIECFQRANALLEKLNAADPAALKPRLDLASNHNQIAICLKDLGRFPEALEEYRTALRIREQASREDPRSNPIKYWVANVHGNIGHLLESMGRRDEALESHRKALAIREALVRSEPDALGFLDTLAGSYLSMHDFQQGPLKLEWAQRAVDLSEEVNRRAPGSTEYQRRLIGSLCSLADAQQEAGQSAEAEKVWRRALDLLEPAVRSLPTNTDLRDSLTRVLRSLSERELSTGRSDQGLQTLRRATEVLERLIEDDPGVRYRRRSLAALHVQVGRLLRERGRTEEADRSFLKARQQYETLIGEAPNDPDISGVRYELASCHNAFGAALWFAGDYGGSAEAHRQGNIIYSELLKTDPGTLSYREGLAICQTNLGNSHRESGDTDAAVESYRRAIATASELVRASPDTDTYRMTLARSLNNLGWILQKASRHGEARQAYRQAIDQARVAFDRAPRVSEHRSMLSEAYSGLAWSLRSLGEGEEAARATRTRKAIWPGHPDELYRIAGDLALCVPITADGERMRATVADALVTMREAIAAGWNDAGRISRDPAFAPLRDCDDFRMLLGELFDKVFPADPFAR